jgi:hypothetical protein
MTMPFRMTLRTSIAAISDLSPLKVTCAYLQAITTAHNRQHRGSAIAIFEGDWSPRGMQAERLISLMPGVGASRAAG